MTVTPEEIARRLAPHTGRLRELGVRSLGLFGSAARGEAHAGSDLDIVVDFEGRASFDRYFELKFLLEDVLGRRIDLDILWDVARNKVPALREAVSKLLADAARSRH